MPYNTEKIRHAYKSKHNSFLFINDGEKWHYLAVKNDLHY